MNQSKYTRQDLKVLIELCNWEVVSTSNTPVARVPDDNGTWNVTVINLETTLWDESLEFPCSFTSRLRNFLYKVPFEDIPAYLGDPFYFTFAHWRLEIGK